MPLGFGCWIVHRFVQVLRDVWALRCKASFPGRGHRERSERRARPVVLLTPNV